MVHLGDRMNILPEIARESVRGDAPNRHATVWLTRACLILAVPS